MKKILSILLALSIACGSVMLTSCGVDEKEDDDKSVSDKERDEDEDEEDEDKDKESSEDDEESSESEDESSEDEESSESEDESSEDEESSESEDESSEDEESSESEDESSEDGTYAAGDVVEFSGVSFIVPEGFTCEVTDGYAEITSEDEYALESINVQATSADDISTYSQETFDGMYEKIYSDSFTSGTYEVSTLDGADTIYYTASIAMEGISMELIQYCIFLEDASIIATMGYVDGEVAATMDAFVDSFEIL
ncbi:MAG: hypothetical protein IJO29_03505 [Oscillospiraceae bacterium]|nr:hypothetical protein [Oscillospiraceae bacterium]